MINTEYVNQYIYIYTKCENSQLLIWHIHQVLLPVPVVMPLQIQQQQSDFLFQIQHHSMLNCYL